MFDTKAKLFTVSVNGNYESQNGQMLAMRLKPQTATESWDGLLWRSSTKTYIGNESKSNLKQKNAKICLEVGEMWVLWVCGCGTVGRAVASNAVPIPLSAKKILSKQNLEAAFKMFDKVTHHFIIISFFKF